MSTYSRAGFKWSVNEILKLQREFELLGLSIDEIASSHNRSPDAIMYKLSEEGFADYNVLYSNYHDLNSPMPVKSNQIELDASSDLGIEDEDEDEDDKNEDQDEDYVGSDDEDEEEDDDDEDDEVANLSERVDGLEEGINEIRSMIKQLMSTFSGNSNSSANSFMYSK